MSEELTKEKKTGMLIVHIVKHTHTEFLFSSLSYRSRTLRRVFSSLQSLFVSQQNLPDARLLFPKVNIKSWYLAPLNPSKM